MKEFYKKIPKVVIILLAALVALFGAIFIKSNRAEAKEVESTAEAVSEICADVAALYLDESKELLAEDATMEKVTALEGQIADAEDSLMDSETADSLALAREDLYYAKSMIELRDSAALLLDDNGALVVGADVTSAETKAAELQPEKPTFVESQMPIINDAKNQEQQIATATAAVNVLFTDETRTTVRSDVTRDELNKANEQIALIKQQKAKDDLTALTAKVDDYLTQVEADEKAKENSKKSENKNSNSEDYGMLVLVNKQNPLSSSYVPPDLVTPDVYLACSPGSDKSKLRKEAADALELMFADALEQGIQLSMVSGYRSYDRQAELFADEVADCGGDEEEAAKTVARPGTSEHQTGLAVDISSPNFGNQLEEEFGSTPEGIWLQENAHKYGFILRYPKECTDHTGIYYEPWHYRYVGVGPATEIYNQGICLEEYLQ